MTEGEATVGAGGEGTYPGGGGMEMVNVNVNGGPEGVVVDGVVTMVDDVDKMERADDGAALAGIGDNATSIGALEMEMVEMGGLTLSFFGGNTNGKGATSSRPQVLAASADAGATLSAWL